MKRIATALVLLFMPSVAIATPDTPAFMVQGNGLLVASDVQKGQATTKKRKSTRSGKACGPKKYFDTTIDVNVDIKPIKYDRSIDLGLLNFNLRGKLYAWQKENKSNYFLDEGVVEHEELLVSGSNSSKVTMDAVAEIVMIPYTGLDGYYCPYYKKITVDVTYQTEITIAKEVEDGSCMYNVVHEHELRHHDANVKVVQSIAQKLEEDLPYVSYQIEGDRIHRLKSKDKWAQMESDLLKAVNIYQEDIETLIEEYNKVLDTPEEFRRIANACGGKGMKKDE